MSEEHPLHGTRLKLKPYQDLMKEGDLDELYKLAREIAKKDHDDPKRSYETLSFLRAIHNKGKKLRKSLEEKVMEGLEEDHTDRDKKLKDLEKNIEKTLEGKDGMSEELQLEYAGKLMAAVFTGTTLGNSNYKDGLHKLIVQQTLPYLEAAAEAIGQEGLTGQALLGQILKKINDGEISGDEGAIKTIRKYISMGEAHLQSHGGLKDILIPKGDKYFELYLVDFARNRKDLKTYVDINTTEGTELDKTKIRDAGYKFVEAYSNPNVSHGKIAKDYTLEDIATQAAE